MWFQQHKYMKMEGGDIVLQICPGIHGQQVQHMGWYTQQRLRTEENPNPNPNPAGKTFMLNGSNLHVYILPWCIGDVNSRQLIPKMHTPQNAHTQKLINDAFFAYHANSTIPAKRICNNLDIATKQQKDKTLAKIVHALQSSHPDGAQIDSNGHRAKLFKRK